MVRLGCLGSGSWVDGRGSNGIVGCGSDGLIWVLQWGYGLWVVGLMVVNGFEFFFFFFLLWWVDVASGGGGGGYFFLLLLLLWFVVVGGFG